jgi:MFS family permease
MKDESDHGVAAHRSSDTGGPIHPSALSPHPSPTHVRWKVMAFLCALSFLTYFDRFNIVRAQDEIKRDLGLQPWQMAWVISAFWLAYALFEIPGGWLGDRRGARRTLIRVVLAWSVFTALSGTATGFVSLLLWRFLFGVGEAGAFPNMARVQSAWLPAHTRARWGGVLWLMARWGGALSPIIVGAMLRAFGSQPFRDLVRGTPLEHLAPWRWGFFGSGLLGVVWVVLFWPFFRDNPSEKKGVYRAELDLINQGRAATAGGDSHAAAPGLFKQLFASTPLRAMALLYLFVSFGWSFFASWIPVFFQQAHGVEFKRSEWMTALPLLLGGISCVAGGTLCDYLVRRTGRKHAYRALFPVSGYLVAATALVCVRFVHTPAQATALLCVAAVASDWGQGSNWATIVDIGGRYAGIAAGLINTVGNLGHFLQPPIGEAVARHLGWNALFLVYACFYCAAACLWYFIDPTRRFYREAPADQAPEPRALEGVGASR